MPTHIEALLDGALGPAGLLRRVHRQHAHRHRAIMPGANAIVAEAQGARRAGRLGAADARVARRTQRLVLPEPRRSPATVLRFSIQRAAPAPTGSRRCCRSAGPPASSRGVTRGGAPVTTSLRTVKGIDYAVFDAAAGDYIGDVRRPARPAGGARDDDHRVHGDRRRGARRVHLRRAGRHLRVPPGRRLVHAHAPTRASTPAWPAASTRSRCGPSSRRGTPDPTPAERIFTVAAGDAAAERRPAPGRRGDGR